MKVNSVDYLSAYSYTDPIQAINANLNALALKNNTTVKALVEEAQSTDTPTPEQTRIVNMVNRLDKLTANNK